jgi:hypothetical protein
VIAKVLWTTLLVSAAMVVAQSPPKDYKPTELQSLRLQVKQKDALLAKQALESAQTNFQKALTDLQAEGDRVKSENGWKDVQFNPNDLSFTEPKKEAVKQ